MRNQLVLSLAATVIGAGAMTAWGDGQIPDRATLDSILGGNQTLEDFESFVIADGGATNLDVAVLDDQTIANGQGPGLVEAGATYTASSNVLQWNGNNYYGLGSRTFLGNSEQLQIDYNPSVTAMGIDARAYIGYGYSGSMTVYDLNNAVVGTINFTLNNGGSENVFVGWEWTAGISRVVLDGGAWSWSPVVDNHGYGRSGGGGFAIRLTGQCPGQKTLAWSGAGSGQMGIIIGNGPGNFTLPGGACAGTQLGLSGPGGLSLYNVIGTQGGSGQVTATVGTGACGKWIQCIKTNNCATSNATGPI